MENLSTNNKPMESQSSPQSIWTIVLSIVITAVIIGGGLYFWQKVQMDALRQEIQDLKTQNEELAEEKEVLKDGLTESTKEIKADETVTAITEPATDTSYATSALCTDAPTGTDIGRDVYPIDPKYNGLGFLGQLFTAYNCGSTRVSKIFGVDGDNYTLGSAIWLKSDPSQALINTFKSVGFKCDEGISDVSCKKWELWDSVKVDNLMKLEPYHENFEADDCRNCG